MLNQKKKNLLLVEESVNLKWENQIKKFENLFFNMI